MSKSRAPRGRSSRTGWRELRERTSFQAYETVRDRVLALLDGGGEAARPSAYWVDELETLEYLLDASPLIIDRLRHHTYPITGIRAYDYRSGKDATRFAEKLAALIELAGGDQLLVPESRALGGFGHEIDGRLCNIDTLKYFEVLIGMERAGVLGALRGAAQRPVVLEIGAGWGGFAYQLKRLFPDVTYVIVDLPELFLFSATYLATTFPDAKTWFWERPGDEQAIPAGRRLRVRPALRARRPRARASRPDGEHGLVPGDDRGAGRCLRRQGARALQRVPLLAEPRAVALQRGADERERRARQAILAARDPAARDQLHEADRSQAREAQRAGRQRLPAPRRDAAAWCRELLDPPESSSASPSTTAASRSPKRSNRC